MYGKDNDVEILCIDDGSIDGSKEYLESIKDDKFHLIDYDRASMKYDENPARQINFLAHMASGKKLLIQSAEIAHVNNIIDGLSDSCFQSGVAFANVLNADQYGYEALKNTKNRVTELAFPGLNLKMEKVVYTKATYRPDSHPVLSYVSNEKINKIVALPQYVMMHETILYTYQEYTGPMRPIPLFFCGMIERNDFLSLGGYSDEKPADVIFGNLMSDKGFYFTFTSDIAVHLDHNKI
jgi:glycosyltransferase involved in cell wall biosynthesis